MKKLIVTAIVGLEFAVCSLAAGTSKALHPEVDMIMVKSGGLIDRPGVMPGRLVVFNTQTNVPSAELQPALDRISAKMHMLVEIRTSQCKNDLAAFQEQARNGKAANLAIFVIDDGSMPAALATYPENGISVVNVADLKKDKPDAKFLIARTRKEIYRAFFFIAGSASASKLENLMGPIKSVKDLDDYAETAVPVDAYARATAYLPKFGCAIRTKVPYKRACQEGWAPAPTNEYQKAIWDKVHTIPTKPIKIEFDPKTDTK